ncbi:MAG: UDP-N-acetylmuramoyl-L-alanine--D-glutamate ligase [Candidatus Komeilibacteria bacterium]|mgnify:CR=1 FL=1|jgi:UDP-N-acetylmuramoylalanine--D-glutamate ligase|nr:UDP-N-acetylmuramoyl-L-alanine--D-glutamate ligase [Candidatus Komeilibacteria bacterium]
MVKSFKGKKVLVMGLGLHGGALSVVKWLLRHGALLTITDTQSKIQLKTSLEKISKLRGAKKIKYSLGGHDMVDFRDQDLIIQNPAVPKDSKFLKKARQKNILIINEAVMFFGLYPGSSIGVTGTRGKSTVSTLIHKILKTTIKTNVVAGNIATNPMFDAIGKLKVNSLPVLELSSWHLEIMDDYKVSPHISVVTNVLNDHLNRYKNFAHYRAAKQVIAKHQVKRDKLVLNADNVISKSFAKSAKAYVYFYSLKNKVKGAYLKNNKIYFNSQGRNSLVMETDKIKLLGQHNLSNILAAVCVAKIVGIANKDIAKAVNNFKGVQYRLEHKANIGGIDIYNDSTSTTPDATMAAIQAMANKKVILIAGGEDKKLDYDKLAKQIKSKVKYLVLLSGSGSDKLKKELKKIKCPQDKIITDVSNLKKAWQLALQAKDRGEVILFSPAAASFNMFKNEFDRAHQFDALINLLRN